MALWFSSLFSLKNFNILKFKDKNVTVNSIMFFLLFFFLSPLFPEARNLSFSHLAQAVEGLWP